MYILQTCQPLGESWRDAPEHYLFLMIWQIMFFPQVFSYTSRSKIVFIHNVRTFRFTFKQYSVLKRVCIFHKQSFYNFIVNFISAVLFSHCGVATGCLLDHIFVSIKNNKCIKYIELIVISKLAITCSKLTKETLGQGMKYLQS